MRYWAFISYSHQDKRVARWLCESIRRQKVPKAYRTLVEPTIANFESIFLDVDEAAASGNLSDELKRALDQSRKLIVICSPFAVASPYVAEEIQHFQRQGRKNDIICVIASGIPNASDQGKPAFECLPLQLRYRSNEHGNLTGDPIPENQRPLAAMLGSESEQERTSAIRQVTAGLLGISVSELLDTALKRAQHIKLIWASILIALCACGLIYFDLFYRPQVKYFSEFVRRNGVWEGVDEVSPSSASARESSYEFHKKGRWSLPDEVRYVGGNRLCHYPGLGSILGNKFTGDCADRFACSAHFEYNNLGQIEEETLVDQYGNDLEKLTYHGTGAEFIEGSYGCSRTPSGISNIIFHRHKGEDKQAGLDEMMQFMANVGGKGVPRPNRDKSYGVRFGYDGAGRLTSQRFLSVNGENSLNSDGIAGWNIVRDKLGREIRRSYVGVREEPLVNRTTLLASLTTTYDPNGNVNEVTLLGVDDKPTLHKQDYANQKSKYDAKGNEVERSYYAADGKLTLHEQGFAVWRAKYDERGNQVEIAYFDTNNNSTLSKDGFAMSRSKFSDQNNSIETAYFDVDGKPVLSKDGIAGYRTKFDEKGNQIEHAYFGIDDKPILTKFGAAYKRHHFDKWGHKIEEAYFGIDGEQTLDGKGVAICRMKYDENGNETDTFFWGIDGKPSLSNDGYAGMHFKYDEQGNQIETSYFDQDGKSTLNEDGISVWHSKFDERGNETEVAFFGIDAKPTLNKDGISGWHAKFDERDREIERAYFDVHNEPKALKDGYAVSRSRYDQRGNLAEHAYLGVNGKPVITKNEGIAGWQSKFDERGNETEVAYFGVDAKPALNKEGIAGWHSKFDERDREIERAYVGVRNEPKNIKDGYAVSRSKYDQRGNLVEEAYFNVDGKPTLSKDGYAGWHNQYDGRGNVVDITYVGADGKPLRTGRAREILNYDARGRMIESQFYDVNGQPIESSVSGRGVVLREYDQFGRIVREISLDRHRRLVNRKDEKWAKMIIKYGRYPNIETRKYFDRRGQEVSAHFMK